MHKFWTFIYVTESFSILQVFGVYQLIKRHFLTANIQHFYIYAVNSNV